MELTEDEIQTKLNTYFQVLHRLARIQEENPLAPAFAPNPLREDIADCVELGWVMAISKAEPELVQDPTEEDGQPSQVRLVLRPEGWEFYDKMCEDMASQGRPVLGWKPNRHSTNPTEKSMVAIKDDDGAITTGTVILGRAAIGAIVTVELRDGNGVPIEATGEVVEVF